MSAEYVDETVARRRDHPREGEHLLVAVGTTGSSDGIADRISELDPAVAITKELPYDTYRVSIPETVLDELCSLPGVKSVERERQVRPHDSGN